MNDKVNGPVEESSEDDVISACVVFDIRVKDNNFNIIQQKRKDGKLVDSLKYHRPFITLPGEVSYNDDAILFSGRAEETKIGEKRKLSVLSQLDFDQFTNIPIDKDEIEEVSKIMDDIRAVNDDDIYRLFTALQLEGLSYYEVKQIVFDGMVYLHLDIDLKYKSSTKSPGFVLDTISIWFMDNLDRRISSVQQIYPRPQKGLFQRMKIGLDAGYKPTDEVVYRNFYCHHCGKKIATGSISSLAEANQLKDLCDGCQEIEDGFNKIHDGENPRVERTYKISGKTSVVDNLEVLFREITTMCNAGASREIKLYVDGDGIVDIDIERTDGEQLKKNCKKSGVLKRERFYGGDEATGYLTYLDLG